MKPRAKKYMIFGIAFLVLGIVMLVTDAVSRTMAYGDFVLACAFFAWAAKENKKPDDDNKE
jgi:drug/metabolite transporter (DMT)-like permease